MDAALKKADIMMELNTNKKEIFRRQQEWRPFNRIRTVHRIQHSEGYEYYKVDLYQESRWQKDRDNMETQGYIWFKKDKWTYYRCRVDKLTPNSRGMFDVDKKEVEQLHGTEWRRLIN